jgi:hypothetical protein
MSHPANTNLQEWYYEHMSAADRIDFELHEQAGLIFAGVSEEGQAEWLGDPLNRQWEEYEKLREDFNNNI